MYAQLTFEITGAPQRVRVDWWARFRSHYLYDICTLLEAELSNRVRRVDCDSQEWRRAGAVLLRYGTKDVLVGFPKRWSIGASRRSNSFLVYRSSRYDSWPSVFVIYTLVGVVLNHFRPFLAASVSEQVCVDFPWERNGVPHLSAAEVSSSCGIWSIGTSSRLVRVFDISDTAQDWSMTTTRKKRVKRMWVIVGIYTLAGIFLIFHPVSTTILPPLTA